MKHFSLKEFTRSSTAEARGISNTPAVCEVARIEELVAGVLDPLRDWYGRPIYVTSGYRSPALNRAVGGSASSQHLRGEAADITAKSRSENKRLFEFIRHHLTFDQLIWEHGGNDGPDWVHVSYKRERQRGQVLRIYAGGKTVTL